MHTQSVVQAAMRNMMIFSTVSNAGRISRSMLKLTICMRAACATSAPPRIAPVIMPGIAIRPTLRAWLGVSQAETNGSSSSHSHLVDGWQQRHFKCFGSHRHACLHPAAPVRQVCLELISVLHHLSSHIVDGYSSAANC